MELLIFAGFILICYLIWLISRSCCGENFWGGYFPVPYSGQPLTYYGRSGLDAATDDPKMLINVNACNINPTPCPNCNSYRCCCQ